MGTGLVWIFVIIGGILFFLAVILLFTIMRKLSTTQAPSELFDIKSNLAQLQSQIQSQLPQIQIEMGALKGLTEAQINTVETLRNKVDEKLTESSRLLTDQLTKNLENMGNTFAAISNELGKLGEASKRILEVGKDIGGLKDILIAPKARGGLGEVLLEQLLGNVLPPEHYEMQYSLGAERVDAIVRMPEGLVPVDSKFPLPAFERITQAQDDSERKKARKEFLKDAKARISEIASKYIKPELGTVDFALMYIPADNVYYEAVTRDEGGDSILEYSLAKKVIPVSPLTFYAYLIALAYGLKGMRVAEHAKKIREHLGSLALDLSKAQEDFETLGRHIQNAANKYSDVGKHFQDFAFKLTQYAELGGGESPASLPPTRE